MRLHSARAATMTNMQDVIQCQIIETQTFWWRNSREHVV